MSAVNVYSRGIPMDVTEMGKSLGVITAAIFGGLGLIYKWLSRNKVTQAGNEAEAGAIKLAQESALQWKAIADDARDQVKAERALRELAETRLNDIIISSSKDRAMDRQKIEDLTTQVAKLEREVDRLSNAIGAPRNVNTP
jgi:hypothetical protein